MAARQEQVVNRKKHTQGSSLAALLSRLIDKDRGIQNHEYRESLRKLVLYCFGFVKDMNVAEDIATESVMKLLHHAGNGPIRNPEAWIFCVAKNHCLNHMEKERGRKRILDSIFAPRQEAVRAGVEYTLALEEYRKALKAMLNDNEQKIWNLYCLGYSNEEISHILGISIKTVANRKTRIRNMLKQLKREGDL